MKLSRVLTFIAAVFVFSFILQASVRAFWIQKNGRLMWFDGQVLGTTDPVVYTYIIRAKPTEVPTQGPSPTPTITGVAAPTVTPTLTPTPQTAFSFIAAMFLQVPNSPTPSPSPTPTPTAQRDIKGPSKSDHSSSSSSSNQGSGGDAGGGTSSSSSSSSSVVTYCGSNICFNTQICFQNVCRERCGADGSCLGLYVCNSGACVPMQASSGSYYQAPTATPYPTAIPPTTAAASGSSSSTPVLPTAYVPNRPTNTPYPTRTPQNIAFFNTPGSNNTALPVVMPPTPTPIPPELRGKESTIVIEEGNTTKIYKGEDMNAINIGVPAAGPGQTTDQNAQTSSAAQQASSVTNSGGASLATNLNLSFQEKGGASFDVQQQELVVEKGKQRVTISVADTNQNNLVLTQNDVKAILNMSLSINPATNILTVNTPDGPLRVSIMPEDAVAIVKELKVADPNQMPDEIQLLSKSSQLQYKISANKLQKILWMIPVNIPQDIYVSAESGGLIAIKKTPLYDFISLFAFNP